MEIKINKEIRDYTEAVFFALTLRQLIFSVLACASALIVYFTVGRYVGTEVVSWMCVMIAAPFALLGFFKYNGMTAERFLLCVIRSKVLMPYKLKYSSSDRVYDMMKPWIIKARKGGTHNV